MKRAITLLCALVIGTGYASAADHPDSVSQPLQDGCNRSQLLLLAEAFPALFREGGPVAFPEWVYVNDPAHPEQPRTTRTLEGTVLGSHTAGQDLFGNHRSYDLNIDVAPDSRYEGLLSTRNTKESPQQIHTEWESGLVPLWAWPSAADRVRETGSWIWDCGHWQDFSNRSGADNLPGDPLGSAGVQSIAGESAEIHPISELATWRHQKGFVPPGGRAAVPVSQLDVYISNQGGGAKAVIECALAPTAPVNAAERAARDGGCSQLQDVTGTDYGYDVVAPPRPSRGAKLRWMQVAHGSHHAPGAQVRVRGDRIHVTVPFKSKHVAPASDLQDFGASYYVWWSGQRPTRRFRVLLEKLVILNNLDGDSGQPNGTDQNGNPSITPNGEWNLYVDVGGYWRALHTEMKKAGAGDLGDIPTKDARHPYNLSKLASTEVDLADTATFRMLTDARDCDLPGFTDCPAGNELAFSQRPGRGELVVPVSRLIGKTTTIDLHPISCPTSCDEAHSDPACKGPCYALTFSIQDVTRKARNTLQSFAGDGTIADTTVNGIPATLLDWWQEPPRPTGFDQDEEARFIERAIAEYRAASAP